MSLVEHISWNELKIFGQPNFSATSAFGKFMCKLPQGYSVGDYYKKRHVVRRHQDRWHNVIINASFIY